MKNVMPLFSAVVVSLALFYATGSCYAAPAKGHWEANGTLLESCTCAVPCSCNFGEPPSPNAYCYAVYAYRLTKASWDGVDLSGLVVAGTDGPNGEAAFLDERATPEQRAVLQRLAHALFAQGGPRNSETQPFTFQKITPSVSGNDIGLKIGDLGGFSAHLIVGKDGKSPVVVENNTIWPIARANKGKSVLLDLHSSTAGPIHATGTNANYGEFTLSGSTGNIQHEAKGGACCGKTKK